ncbi:MAG: oligoendopeptidase F [Thermodesulfobacteriota bacterium]
MNENKIPLRSEVKTKDQWNLTHLYNSDSDWEKHYNEVEKSIKKYDAYKGKLNDSFDSFKKALDFDMDVSRQLEKLFTYAHLKNDEDKTNQFYSGMYQKAVNLHSRISEASSFLIPEIQSIPDETIKSFMNKDSVSDYRFYLEKIIRNKPHTRSMEIEQVLAMATEVRQAPMQIFSQLDNADLKFGTIKNDKGESVQLSHGNFISFLTSPSHEIRKNAFKTFYQAYEDHKHSISAALSASIKKDCFVSKVKNFETCREAALFSDNVSVDVYDNLIETVKTNLDPLFRYLDFRKKMLGLDELHFYDTYVPVVKEVEFKMSYDEAVEVCLKALAPLGKEYTSILEKGLKGGWVDKYENKGKRSGAYSSGCYDSPPYILMNYNENTINSLFTLIHEAGHSMHSYYSCKNQPYATSSYTIFVAEVASTLNETLLGKYLLDLYKDDPKMKAYIINREIDNIRGTMFRQTMFAEFEKISHDIAEKNQPLTLDTITGEYKKLLETYFGDTMVIDDELCLECLRIPHFYSAFYVYKYATGIAAAIAISNKILLKGDSAIEDYLNFLKMGGSDFPINELKTAGVDMNSPEPVENAIKHFENLVTQLENLM